MNKKKLSAAAVLLLIVSSTAWGIGSAATQLLGSKVINGSGTLNINSTGNATVPNQTGNVVVQGNASIVNADVNAAAAIAYSKLNLAGSVQNADLVGPVSVAKGGTNSIAALNNNRVMQSSGGAIQEAAAITASRALQSDANGIPTQSATTATELGFVSGVTSAIQTQINAISASSATNQPYALVNVGLKAAISTNTLVLNLTQSDGATNCSGGSPCTINFRGTTATNGNFQTVNFTAAASVTLGATASVGNSSGAGAFAYIYAIQDTTSELCVSNALLDEGALQSATATPATSGSTLYCTSAHTSRPVRLLGFVSATWSNPNWSAITTLNVWPFETGLSGQVTVQFGAAFASTTPVVVYYSKKGKSVNLTVSSIIATCGSAVGAISTTTHLPAFLAPATNSFALTVSENNSVTSVNPGMLRVQTTGQIDMYKDIQANNYTGSNNCGLLQSATIGYAAAY